jgi:glyoxylase-like metal-dependent hydrolase (beta-lactamase superfamily II)
MKIIHICPSSWGANCYLLVSGDEAYAIDPSPSADAILKRLEAENARLTGIIITHGHFDHVISAETLHNKTGAPVLIHECDDEMLPDPEKNAYKTIFGQDRSFRRADRFLHDGDLLPLGEELIEVIHTPGHTKGCICLKSGDILVTGDTLFSETFGRIDLFGGSLSDMKQSLLRLKKLDPSLTIYPGHGESSNLGKALSNIRFLNR